MMLCVWYGLISDSDLAYLIDVENQRFSLKVVNKNVMNLSHKT